MRKGEIPVVFLRDSLERRLLEGGVQGFCRYERAVRGISGERGAGNCER